MSDGLKLLIGGGALLVALGFFLGAVLSRHIGGFLRTVEREAEEERRQREEENKPETQE